MRRERSNRKEAVKAMIKCIEANTIDRTIAEVIPSWQTHGKSQGPDSTLRYQYFGQVVASMSQDMRLPLLKFEKTGRQAPRPKSEQFDDGQPKYPSIAREVAVCTQILMAQPTETDVAFKTA